MNDNAVYLAWQTPETKGWFIVGALTESESGYQFHYTKGSLNATNFVPFSGMEDLNKSYVSNDLFPLFRNRLLSERRPEYPNFINWLGLEGGEANPLNILARSGAMRGTDKLQMFRRIEIDEFGEYTHFFFLHGLGYLNKSAQKRVDELSKGDRLFLCQDCQNDYDPEAVLVRADKPAEIVGYCPRYLARDINRLLEYSEYMNVTVECSSSEAPTNYRLMCKIKGKLLPNGLANLPHPEEYEFIV